MPCNEPRRSHSESVGAIPEREARSRSASLPFSERSALRFATFLTLFCLCAGVGGCEGCRETKVSRTNAVRAAAAEQSLTQTEIEEVRVYLDATASMRGFALAATRNVSGAANDFLAVLAGLDSLRNIAGRAGVARSAPPTPVSDPKRAATPQAGRIPVPFVAYRFGGVVEEFPAGVSLLSGPRGQTPPVPLGGRAVSADWASEDAGRPWGGSPEVRRGIDAFFSEQVTCLNTVLDRVVAEAGPRRAFVVVTDAEQAAPEASIECPAARNSGSLQTRIHEWIDGGRRFAALAVFRLDYLPWKAKSLPSRYAACEQRLLFAYIFAPSADAGEKLFEELAYRWGGNPNAVAFLPLTPRPASQFDIELELLPAPPKKTASKGGGEPSRQRSQVLDAAVFDSRANGESDLSPAKGILPVFSVNLLEKEAFVAVRLKGVGFEKANVKTVPGFQQFDWTSAGWTWSEGGIRLDFEGPEKTRTKLVPVSGPGSAEMMLVADRPDLGAGKSRNGRFHARDSFLKKTDTMESLPEGIFLIRRTEDRVKDEVFLVELSADTRRSMGSLWAGLELGSSGMQEDCLLVNAVREQVRLAGNGAPVARFLVRVRSK